MNEEFYLLLVVTAWQMVERDVETLSITKRGGEVR